MEFDEEIREFLIESDENLANLDRELVELEQNPSDPNLISSAFRTIHTIKGTCGFFGYSILGSVTHVTENILSQVREGQRLLTPGLISLMLEAMDAVKALLAQIKATGAEGEDFTGPLRARLEAAHRAVDPSGSSSAPPHATFEELEADRDLEVEVSQAAASNKDNDNQLPASTPSPAPSPASAPVAGPAPVALMAQPRAEQNQEQKQEQQASPPTQLPQPSPRDSEEAPDTRQASAETAGRDAQLTDSTIRVDVTLLNRLMNLVGELVLARNQLLQDTSALNPALQQASQRLNLITSELQEGVMKTRMQPIGVVWNKLPRVVRDLASQCGKRIRIEMEGADTELDKTIIEAIRDPLTHIVRNSCDHGIEMPETRAAHNKKPEGLLLLRAYHEGGVVNIEITDDGAGIDPERVKAKAVEKGLLRPEQAQVLGAREARELIFLPGFSTAAQITSISGRGVGMDVVKTNIEKIGGKVEIQPGLHAGTIVRIRIPLTLAIIPGLLVTLDARRLPSSEAGRPSQERFILPQANLVELVRLEGAELKRRIEQVHGTPIFHHRGHLLPLVSLAKVLGLPERDSEQAAVNIVVVQAENRQVGLVVDGIGDTQEIVVKPLGRQLKALSCYVGATIMGDGRPALILDVAGLARLAGLKGPARPVVEIPEAMSAVETEMVLLFSAGGQERIAVPLRTVDRLEEIPVKSIESAGGRRVLCYRGEILPLMQLDEQNQRGASSQPSASRLELDRETSQVAQVVVFTDGIRKVGLIVDRIVDIVNEPVAVPSHEGSAILGISGSAILGGRITSLLDLSALGLQREVHRAPPGSSAESSALLGAIVGAAE
jgi:two-component system chemotaxis sensor kinase CheA